MVVSSHSRLTGVLVGLLLLGCSDNPPTGPSPLSTADVKVLIAEMSPIGTIRGSTWTVPRDFLPNMIAPLIDPASCTYSYASGFFECPDTTVQGDKVSPANYAFTRMYRLIDAGGKTQSQPDANTWAIEVKTTVKGTSTEAGSPTVLWQLDGQSDMTLTGIGTNTHVLNGLTVTQVDMRLVYVDTVETANGPMVESASNLVLPNLKAGRENPIGTFTLLQPRGMDTGNTTLRELTFDGSNIAALKTKSDFGTMICLVKIGEGPNPPDQNCTTVNP